MTMPAALEPAFIEHDKLGAVAEYVSKTSSPKSGSTSTGSLSPLPSTPEGEIKYGGLPDFEYPAPLFVRNTFIDGPIMRPVSLDEFYEERRVHSCPVEFPTPLSLHSALSEEASLLQPIAGGAMMESMMAAAASASAAAAEATRCWLQIPSYSPAVCTSVQGHSSQQPSQTVQSHILRLADSLPEPIFESSELSTIGSAGHGLGNCKPCAFFHTKGCGNGYQCPFCHLCPAGEKKRRQKTKATFQRGVERMGFMSFA